MRKKRATKNNKEDKKNTGVIRNLAYDSLEELYFFYWCFELLDRGYIEKIERALPYHLSDSVTNNYSIQLKTKSKPGYQNLLAGHVYTPEVKIVWNNTGAERFVWIFDSHTKKDKPFVGHRDDNKVFSIVEIKPLFDYKNMERLATLNVKWVYQKYGEFVNIIKCPKLFEETFTPKNYLITSSGKKRKIKWQIRNMDSYLKMSTDGTKKLHNKKMERVHNIPLGK